MSNGLYTEYAILNGGAAEAIDDDGARGVCTGGSLHSIIRQVLSNDTYSAVVRLGRLVEGFGSSQGPFALSLECDNISGVVSSVTPSSGVGSTVVTIAGTGLRGGGATVVAAALAGVPCTILSESDTEVVVRAGVGPAAGSAGNVSLGSTTHLVSASLQDAWIYLPQPVPTPTHHCVGGCGTTWLLPDLPSGIMVF